MHCLQHPRAALVLGYGQSPRVVLAVVSGHEPILLVEKRLQSPLVAGDLRGEGREGRQLGAQQVRGHALFALFARCCCVHLFLGLCVLVASRVALLLAGCLSLVSTRDRSSRVARTAVTFLLDDRVRARGTERACGSLAGFCC